MVMASQREGEGNRFRPAAWTWYQGLLVASLFFCQSSPAFSFAPNSNRFQLLPEGYSKLRQDASSRLYSSGADPESEISRTLARAKELLEKSKAKLEAKEKAATAVNEGKKTVKDAEPDEPLPFFASAGKADDSEKRSRVTKFKDEATGLITTDGEMMAKLSEEEQWEARALLDVFESEIQEADGSSTIMERDIAASIRSMKSVMQMEDYKKIFDPRNRFIGEDN